MNLWLPAVALGSSLILIAMAIPLIRRRVPPNAAYGLRVPATFADEWVWYEANARSGRDLLALGVVSMALALAIPILGFSIAAYLAWAAVLFAGAIATCVLGWLRANRLLKEKRQTP